MARALPSRPALAARAWSEVSTGSQKLTLPPTSVTLMVTREPAPRTISVAVRLTGAVVPWNQFIPGWSGDTLRFLMLMISIVSMPLWKAKM